MFEVGDEVLIVGPHSRDSVSVSGIGFMWGIMDEHIGLKTTIRNVGISIRSKEDGTYSEIRTYALTGVDWVWAEEWLESIPDSDEIFSPPADNSDILSLLQG